MKTLNLNTEMHKPWLTTEPMLTTKTPEQKEDTEVTLLRREFELLGKEISNGGLTKTIKNSLHFLKKRAKIIVSSEEHHLIRDDANDLVDTIDLWLKM